MPPTEGCLTRRNNLLGEYRRSFDAAEVLFQVEPVSSLARHLRSLTARQLIVAGGIRSQGEIDALEALGGDAVAGMAVYSGILAI